MKSSRVVEVDVAIIGAGSAGLAACSEVEKVTDNFVLVQYGEYGTTCVRSGCMPCSALIHAVSLFHQRHLLYERGIKGGELLEIDIPSLLRYVRTVRQHFLNAIFTKLSSYKDHYMEGFARFVSPHQLRVGETLIHAQKIIIATGSSPVVPEEWQDLSELILTSETLFEQGNLPSSIAVVGLSMLGIEIAQVLSRAGVDITGFDAQETLGGLTDPVINSYVFKNLSTEIPLWLGHPVELSRVKDKVQIVAGRKVMLADKVFLALGREPNLQHMGLEALGIVDKGKLTLSCDPHTMQIGNLPIYMAGDVRQERPLLHEAQDDGHIAGYNAVHTPSIHFKRRTLLTIVHTDPAIVKAGAAWENLPPKSFHTGETTFENQEGALLLGQQVGYVRIYAHKETAVILGAEMLAPLGEHLGHLLAWLIAQKVTVFQALCMTFYHPLIEESLKKALQELADKFPEEVGKYPIDLQEYAA